MPSDEPIYEDVTPSTPNPDMTPEMRDVLNQHIARFRAEWFTGEDGERASPKQIAKKTRDDLVELLPDAITRITKIIRHSPIENKMAYDASKYVIDAALSEKGIAKTDDPMQTFLEEMADAANARLDKPPLVEAVDIDQIQNMQVPQGDT